MKNQYSIEKYGRTGSDELFKRHLVQKCGLTPEKAALEIKMTSFATALRLEITPFSNQQQRMYWLRTKRDRKLLLNGAPLSLKELRDFLHNKRR